MRRSRGELAWEALADQFNLPKAETEYPFAKDIGRRWRFDFAYVRQKVAVEIDGGIFPRKAMGVGRHVRPIGFQNDAEKLNAAQSMGWIVLRFTPQMLRKDPASCIARVRDVLTQRARREP